VLAVVAAGAAHEEFILCSSGRQHTNRYCHRSNKKRMTNNAYREKRVATNDELKSCSPDEAESLKNIMPNSDIGNVAEGA
jgi:hypothetical protein